MDQPTQLIPLRCVRCNTALPAEPDEVAWVCPQCGQGQLLDDDQGLQSLSVQYAQGIPPGVQGWPYWVADGRVQLQRSVLRQNRQAEADSAHFWSQPRRFFIPAYRCTLEELLAQATQLLLQPPGLQSAPPAPFRPVILAPQDIQPAVDFIVMAVEAGRKDSLHNLQISVKLSPPALWILP